MLRNGLEPWHLLIVAIVFIALFGSKKLPDTARAVGKSLRILKSETKAMREEGGAPADAAAPPAPPASSFSPPPPSSPSSSPSPSPSPSPSSPSSASSGR
ncbi:Sec-independent protein translocase subunit TatA [Streptomyces sp. NPDC101062]|uniref:Sec-independent protein translocase subunit TatA n=1 Tax=unclassified Streptomyces TaxID=2593676 RepID=UPI002E7A9EDA|nr:Sec-independent protein translocase subunit TatA [Streptomyces sp. JV176]MEE1799766.1 Sec-independent protein translocase subunit TatA [Streptomyces sp. JV176]